MLEFTFPEKQISQRRKPERKQVIEGDSVVVLTRKTCLCLTHPIILWECWWYWADRCFQGLWPCCFCDPKEVPQSVISNLDIYKHTETLIHSITANFLALNRDVFPFGLGNWESQGIPESRIQANILIITEVENTVYRTECIQLVSVGK